MHALRSSRTGRSQRHDTYKLSIYRKVLTLLRSLLGNVQAYLPL